MHAFSGNTGVGFITGERRKLSKISSKHKACSRTRSTVPVVAASTDSLDPATATQVRMEVTRRIKELGRAGKLKSAVQELAQMARLGVTPDIQASTALLDACARNRKMELAETVFTDMFGEYVEPDDVTFCTLIRGYGAFDPPKWTDIKRVVRTMETKFQLAPGIRVYNVLLEICAKSNDLEMAEEIIDRMAAAGIQPDPFTVGAVQRKRAFKGLVRRLQKYIEEDEIPEMDE